MTQEYNLESLKEFSENPFIKHKLNIEFDESFIDGLSKTAKNLIKYLMCKHSFTQEKFKINLVDYNNFMKYINVAYPHDGILELCLKKVLAKSRDENIYWVNNELFNTGIFQGKEIKCTEEDTYT